MARQRSVRWGRRRGGSRPTRVVFGQRRPAHGVGVVEEVDRRGLSLANDGRRAPADRSFGLHLSGGHLTAPRMAATGERWSSPALLCYHSNLTEACVRFLGLLCEI
ncbi:Os05g0487500 [Oryza sativa Japonica Group]|uniref:Os05g0487500 protein n=1 Tax=Oryza sativa subsp. japonica TaxID=39947 RepID=A0A0P0WP13_ORYSJ|nr:Os05g0487500 [Oryza sativa Japonica Group]